MARDRQPLPGLFRKEVPAAAPSQWATRLRQGTGRGDRQALMADLRLCRRCPAEAGRGAARVRRPRAWVMLALNIVF